MKNLKTIDIYSLSFSFQENHNLRVTGIVLHGSIPVINEENPSCVTNVAVYFKYTISPTNEFLK